MRLTTVTARDFLALSHLDLALDRDRVVITGPNGVGKSSVLAVGQLANDALAGLAGHDLRDRLNMEWAAAGHEGAGEFEVRLGVRFDTAQERDLLGSFTRAAYLTLLDSINLGDTEALAAAIGTALDEDAAEPLTDGTLVIRYDSHQRDPWAIGWEFQLPHGTCHVGLAGATAGSIVDGPLTLSWPNVSRVPHLSLATNNLAARVAGGEVTVQLAQIIPGAAVEFAVRPTRHAAEAADIENVLAALGGTGLPEPCDTILFGELLHHLVHPRLLVTPNHRVPP